MERKARRYRWVGSVFGGVVVAELIALPYAIRCCSRFSADVQKFRTDAHWDPHVGWFAKFLLDWPMEFRLVVMTITAAILCLLATMMLSLLSRVSERQNGADGRGTLRWLVFGARTAVASFMVAVLYLLAIYACGYVGYMGPRNLVWYLGIPVLVALIEYPRPAGALLGVPLAITGSLCVALISLTVGIPLD
jgi:hypothetical protein